MALNQITPDFRVIANSTDITEAIRKRLISLRVVDERGMQSDTLEIRLDDFDNQIQLPARGAKLDVSLGYKESGLGFMGVFTVDESELSGPPDELIIRAKSADVRGSLKAQINKVWDNVSVYDLVDTIAQSHKLIPSIDGAFNTFHIPHLDQTDESDLHLLTRLSREHDALFSIKNDRLLFVKRAAGKNVSGNSLPTINVIKTDVSRWRATIADRSDYKSVIAHWHNTATGERVPVTAGAGEPSLSIKHNYSDHAAAEAAAASKYITLSRGKSTLSLSLPGNISYLAESPMTTSGFRPGVNGDWIVTKATHEINDAGYTTRLEAEVPK